MDSNFAPGSHVPASGSYPNRDHVTQFCCFAIPVLFRFGELKYLYLNIFCFNYSNYIRNKMTMNAAKFNKIKSYYRFLKQDKFVLDDAIVGAKIKSYDVKVTRRDVSNYAASIGDANPRYYEKDDEGKIIAHPLLPVKYSWAILENPDSFGQIKLPENFQSRLIHISEHLIFKRPLFAGDSLMIRGEIGAILPHRLGCKLYIKFDYFDHDDNLVLTEIAGALLSASKCSGKGKSILDLLHFSGNNKNDTKREIKMSVDRLAPYLYDGCTDIVSPIHTEHDFAVSAGLPDIILQGTATLARGISLLINKKVVKHPKYIHEVAGRFSDFVTIPNTLILRTFEDNDDTIDFEIVELGGKKVMFGLIKPGNTLHI